LEGILKNYLLHLFITVLFILTLNQCTIPESDDVLPPIVNLIFPVDGSVVSGNIVVTVQASDDRDVTRIWYTLDGELIEGSDSERADFQLNLEDYADEKEHVFQAGAVDNSGNNSVSPQAIVIISASGDVVPPSVVITNPLTGRQVVDTTIVIADALDDNYISEVAFFVNGDSVTRDLSYPYQFIWDVSDLPDFTEQTVYARAFDGARNRTNSENVTINVVPSIDLVPPTARLLYPLAGQLLYGVVLVQVDANDDRQLDQVEFYINGILRSTVDASVEESPFSFSWDTRPLAENSQHSLFFKAIDTAGNESDNEATLFTIGRSPDVIPPSLTLLYPQDGDTITATVIVSVDVSDNEGVNRVEYYVDGGQTGNGLPNHVATARPWRYVWDTTDWADRSQHTLYIKAFDNSDNERTFGPITLTIF
jgi:hypothetical protein